MLVYGDPSFSIRTATLAAALQKLAETATSLDGQRDLLVACGQIEQGFADAELDDAPARALTDRAADLFLQVLNSSVGGSDAAKADNASIDLPTPLSENLRIKVPEGFAFYAVYPEQYLAAAEAWLTASVREEPILVVGIRSIGTSLSALVSSFLRRQGRRVQRITVRPRGHPYNREVRLPILPERFEQAVVVDEGPGRSGSSIAATILALRSVGVPHVGFFPSHAGEPGSAASDATRQIWRSVPRFVVPTVGDDFRASPLFATLKRRSEQLLGNEITDERDLSAGQWRTQLAERKGAFAVPELERTKFLFCAGKGEGVLWKFAGLGCGPGLNSLSQQAFLRQRRLARIGWCAPPLDLCSGFIATAWLKGEPMGNADPATARALARYLLDAAKPPPEEEIALTQFRRLQEMTVANIKEALGPALAVLAQIRMERTEVDPELPAYGDGRMGPIEWIRDGQKLLKTDIWGHDLDHTYPGVQSVLWDVAGTIEEWQFSREVEAAFLNELSVAGLVSAEPSLNSHRLAYCSFKMGLGSMFGHDSPAEYWEQRTRSLLLP